ncbi:unnamed protein product, partial [Effrenium voratum]
AWQPIPGRSPAIPRAAPRPAWRPGLQKAPAVSAVSPRPQLQPQVVPRAPSNVQVKTELQAPQAQRPQQAPQVPRPQQAQQAPRPQQAQPAQRPQQAQQAQRPHQAGPVQASQASQASPATGKLPGLKVSTTEACTIVGISILVGDYVDVGANHGRRYYERIGTGADKVFLYFWDKRDGVDQSGWWFGSELGGLQVWARHAAHSLTPPRTGWKVPWDDPKSPDELLVELQAATSAQSPVGSEAQKTQTPQKPETSAVDKTREEVEQAVEFVKAAVQRCTVVLGAKSGIQQLEELLELLKQRQQFLLQASRTTELRIGAARSEGATP